MRNHENNLLMIYCRCLKIVRFYLSLEKLKVIWSPSLMQEKTTRLNPSCALEACFVSHRFTDPLSPIPESGKGRGDLPYMRELRVM